MTATPPQPQTSPAGCEDHHVLFMLSHLGFASNQSKWDMAMQRGNNCHHGNDSGEWSSIQNTHSHIGKDVYAYLTPFIIVIGVFGNSISLRVFTSASMKKLSASIYLAAISLSDMLVLLTYVLLDWLNKGLPRWSGTGNQRLPLVNKNGICQIFLFLSYTFRFTSVWLIVVFTIERYIAVCKPLHRRIICTKACSRRIILGMLLAASIVSLYKPILSDVHVISRAREHHSRDYVCSGHPDMHKINFILDSTYGLLITALPFLLITTFNVLILKTLLTRDFGDKGKTKVVFKENRVRLEFTLILLSISTCFVLLNIPYFVVWSIQSIVTSDFPGNIEEPGNHSKATIAMTTSDQLYITRTIFYLNYAINVFLYYLTGRQYRIQMRNMLLPCKPRSERWRGFVVPTADSIATQSFSMNSIRSMNKTPRD